MKPSMEHGIDFAEQLLPAIRYGESHYTQDASEEDLLIWWTAFMGVLVGAMGASIGPQAVDVVGQVMKSAVEEVSNERTH